MSRREVERLNRWLESTRAPVPPSTWREWAVDALAMVYIGVCGFIIVWVIFAS